MSNLQLATHGVYSKCLILIYYYLHCQIQICMSCLFGETGVSIILANKGILLKNTFCCEIRGLYKHLLDLLNHSYNSPFLQGKGASSLSSWPLAPQSDHGRQLDNTSDKTQIQSGCL